MRVFLVLILCAWAWAANGDNAAASKNSEDTSAAIGRITDEVKKAVESRFLAFYKNYNITIERLDVKLAMDSKIEKMKFVSVNFDDKLLRNSSGNFEVNLVHNQKRQRVFFTFDISASIDALHATGNIKSNEVIDKSNTQLGRLQINRLNTLPSKPEILGEYSTKSFIPSGSVIVDSKITPKIILQKGESISVSYNDNGIKISFEAKALEDAYTNKIIRAQSLQGNKNINIQVLNAKEAILK